MSKKTRTPARASVRGSKRTFEEEMYSEIYSEGEAVNQEAFKAKPAKPRIVIDWRQPVEVARKFIESTNWNGQRTLFYFDKDLYSWDGTKDRELDTELLRKAVFDFLEKGVTPEGNRNYAKPADVQTVLASLIAKTPILENTSPFWIDGRTLPDPNRCISCANGIVDLATRLLTEPTPHLFSLNSVSYAFDANAPAPETWLAFLNAVWPNDQESIDLLQEIFGYILSGDTSFQKIFQIIGPRRSGKGTILNTLLALLGNENVVAPTLAQLSEQFGLQSWIGKKLAAFSDARLSGRSDGVLISERLLSISGEDPQTIDRKYKLAWFGKLFTRILLISNGPIMMEDESGALPGRMIVLQTTTSYSGREDIHLKQKLLPELPSILNWSIEGLHRLWARGQFIQPESANAMVEIINDLANPHTSFLSDCCDVGPSRSCRINDLYEVYLSHCESTGLKPAALNQFGKMMIATIPGLKIFQERPVPGAKKQRHYLGVSIKDAWSRGGTRSLPLCIVKKDEPEKKGE